MSRHNKGEFTGMAQDKANRVNNVTGKYPNLERCCLEPFEWFQQFGELVTTAEGRYIYHRTPGAKILAAAHLDSVTDAKHFHVIEQSKATLVHAATLDDRLGAWLILYVLRNKFFNMEYDILLTEGEETGRSTAAYFKPPEGVSYNWGFECDRTSDDVVAYQYDNADLRKRLIAAGFRVGQGSFTDISALDDVGCEFFNVGVGYYDYHTWRAYAVLEETYAQMLRLKAYYDAHKDELFPYVPRPRTTYVYTPGSYSVRKFEGYGYRDDDYTPMSTGTNALPVFIKCKWCNIKYDTRWDNGKSVEKTGYCLSCAYRIKNVGAKELKEGDVSIRCRGCNTIYTTKMESHLEDVESLKRTGRCQACDAAHKAKVVHIVCPICARSYENPSIDATSIEAQQFCLRCAAEMLREQTPNMTTRGRTKLMRNYIEQLRTDPANADLEIIDVVTCSDCARDFAEGTPDADNIDEVGVCTTCEYNAGRNGGKHGEQL